MALFQAERRALESSALQSSTKQHRFGVAATALALRSKGSQRRQEGPPAARQARRSPASTDAVGDADSADGSR